MTDLIARLRVEANAGNSASVIGGVAKDVQQLGQSGAKAGAGLDQATAAGGKLDRELQQITTHGAGARRGLDQAEVGARGFERSANGARAAGIGLGAALAAIGGRELASTISSAAFTMQGFETGLSAVTGGAKGAAEAQAFVRTEAERMGLVIKTATADYMSLAAATNGTALAGENTRKIWLGVNEAGTVLNLTQERQQLAMAAISQMASKQVISQEELREQLSSALPGALQVAQRALGLTSQEFNKLVESGKLLADDFLPKFADQLRKEFGPGVEQALITPLGQARVEIAKFKNSIFDLEVAAGGEFLGGMREGLTELNAELASPQAQEAARALGRLLGEGLSDAASIAAFLAQNINGIALAAQLVVGVGLARWIATTTIEARAAAAAYLLKAQTATAGAASATEGAIVEGRAVTSLRGAIEAAARAELQGAVAAREAALAREALAAATLRQHGAQLQASASAQTSTRNQAAYAAAHAELTIAQNATVAASARAEVAQAGLTRASSVTGAAMRGLSGAASGLMGLLGGPWGIAFMAAGAAVAFVAHEVAEGERRAQEALVTQQSYAAAMSEASAILAEAGVNTRAFASDTRNAISPTDSLTGSTRDLTVQTLKLADARRQAAVAALAENETKLRQERDDILKRGERTTEVVVGVKTNGDPIKRQMMSTSRVDQLNTGIAASQAAQIGLIVAKPTGDKPSTAPTPPASATGKADRQELRAQIKDTDLAAAVAAQNAYTAALVAGGAALDNWKVQEAGRQAVERLALADRPKLTASETALVASIQSHAESLERVKIANERIEKSVGLTKSADLDTAALQRRALAAAQGEAAIEALQVSEAGARVMQQLGVDTLDQLTGKTLEHAKAAIASAQASERQSIATQKTERVAAQIRDLDKRLASELAYAAALKGGTSALVEYQRAEFERQEIERAGTNLTDDQVVAIRAKAKALFAVQAAADSAQLDVRQAEELRLARLTNSERAIEERFLQRKSLLLAEHATWTKEEVDARARALALADQAAAEDAAAIGDLKQGLEDAFVESGELGMDQVGDYAERALRKAIYKAWLAEPINLIVNAVVGSISGLTGSIGSAGAQGGIGGVASLFNGAGGLAGLASGSGKVITDLLNKTSMSTWNAAKFGGMAGGAIGGAGTGMLVSSLAGMLGMKQSKGNQIGGTIGGAIGSFIPIPGGALIGSVLGNLVGGLVGGKKSNEAAVVSLDQAGAVTSIGGAKRTDETTAAAQSIASAVAQIQAALVAGGATLGATVSKIDIGQRDPTHLNFSNGMAIDTAVGDTAAAVEAATRTIIANAKWATQAQTDYAQKMVAAGASLEQVIATLQTAGGLSTSLDDAIAQLVDPAAYERKAAMDAIEANYQALKVRAQELIAAGLATSDVLGKIERLKDLQIEDALKRLGEVVEETAEVIDTAGDKLRAGDLVTSIDDAILKITDPAAFAKKSAVDGVNKNYEAMKVEANKLIAAGLLSGDVLGKLEVMRDLQIQDALAGLVVAAKEATDVFADARPRLQSWLDGLSASNDNQLNPAEELKIAQAQYDRQLAMAQRGDADALGSLTSYADRLLAGDREATSSATDRLATFNRVTGDVTRLTGMSGSSSSDPVVATLQTLGLSLTALVANTSGGPAGGGLAGAISTALLAKPTILGNSPDFTPVLVQALTPQTDRLSASIDRMRADLVVKLDEVRAATSIGSNAVSAAVEAGLSAVQAAVENVEASAQGQAAAFRDLSDQTSLNNLFIRQKLVGR